MARDHEGTIWDALAMGEETLIRRADTSAFNWKGTHPRFGSVVHAVCFGLIAHVDEHAVDGYKAYYDLITDDDEGVQKRLALLEYTMEQGADPHIIAPKTCDDSRSWEHDDDADLATPGVHFAEKNAVTCLLSAKRVVTLAMAEGDWSRKVERIDRALDLVSRASRRRDFARASVSERVLDTWAGVLADTSTADVAILVQEEPGALGKEGRERERGQVNPGGGGAKIHAHSAVLRAASPVLAAMLSQGMREGDRREISVRDCSRAAVKVLLALLYTSGLPAELADASADTLIEAMTLAHRWNVQHVVQMLAPAIAKVLDPQVIESAMEVAMSLNMTKLLHDCRQFVIAHEREMRARLMGRGPKGLPAFRLPVVRAEVTRLLRIDPSYAESAPSKRMRLL